MEIYYVASFSSRWKHITCHRLLSDTWDFENVMSIFSLKKQTNRQLEWCERQTNEEKTPSATGRLIDRRASLAQHV
jgi:hypothetical protein